MFLPPPRLPCLTRSCVIHDESVPLIVHSSVKGIEDSVRLGTSLWKMEEFCLLNASWTLFIPQFRSSLKDELMQICARCSLSRMNVRHSAKTCL